MLHGSEYFDTHYVLPGRRGSFKQRTTIGLATPIRGAAVAVRV